MKLVTKLYGALVLALVVLWGVVRSSLQVAAAILARSPGQAAAIIDLPLGAGQQSGSPAAGSPAGSHDPMSDGAIALLAHLITLMPGTLSVDVSDDRRILYVHAVCVRDPDALRRGLDHRLKRRVMELWQ